MDQVVNQIKDTSEAKVILSFVAGSVIFKVVDVVIVVVVSPSIWSWRLKLPTDIIYYFLLKDTANSEKCTQSDLVTPFSLIIPSLWCLRLSSVLSFTHRYSITHPSLSPWCVPEYLWGSRTWPWYSHHAADFTAVPQGSRYLVWLSVFY